ncbi:MAG: triose-phosphate isomerase [Bacteriovoracaceae bacterium]
MSRKTMIIGNWKMNQTLESIKEFFMHLEETEFKTELVAGFAPQALHAGLAQDYATRFGLVIGTQDCSAHEDGAFTGELSLNAIKEMDLDFVLVGHSERRQYHKEDNELLNTKNKLALSKELDVIYCIGETLEERESEKTFDVLKDQLIGGLRGISREEIEGLTIAYEPVWAIGTGKTATSEQAEEAHKYIRGVISEAFDAEIANGMSILYGGSVKPANVKELLAKENVDGALVGGASLKADSFAALCK